MMRPSSLLGWALGSAFLPLSALAQSPLPVGSAVQGKLSEGQATYVFEASAAGYLTVIVRAEGGLDVALSIADPDEQVLPDGHSDSDIDGDLGAEQLVVAIPGAGPYLIMVESFGEDPGSFLIGGSFLATDAAAGTPDVDARPTDAIELAVGAAHEDSLHPEEGDRADWYRIAVKKAGVLTVLTRAEGEGDLRLERYAEGSFRDPEDVSDQDMDGVLGNESLTVDVAAGEVVYIKVVPSLGNVWQVSYRLSSGLIGG